MKFAITSDLHLEFKEVDIKKVDADTLVLAGDICVAARINKDSVDGKRIKDFFDDVTSKYKNVIYVAGNHEYYHGKLHKTEDILADFCSNYPNLYYLQNSWIVIDDVIFIGGTLWADLNKGNPVTMYTVHNALGDYRFVTNDARGYTKLRPTHTLGLHTFTKAYIDRMASEFAHKKCVVVTHHAPSTTSIDPMFKDDFHMNGGYASDLSELILNRSNIAAWCHGHIHAAVDYKIGNTRVVSSPRGYYGYDHTSLEYTPKLIEI